MVWLSNHSFDSLEPLIRNTCVLSFDSSSLLDSINALTWSKELLLNPQSPTMNIAEFGYFASLTFFILRTLTFVADDLRCFFSLLGLLPINIDNMLDKLVVKFPST